MPHRKQLHANTQGDKGIAPLGPERVPCRAGGRGRGVGAPVHGLAAQPASVYVVNVDLEGPTSTCLACEATPSGELRNLYGGVVERDCEQRHGDLEDATHRM